MKIYKALILFITLTSLTSGLQAQSPTLNKEQTLDYINELFAKAISLDKDDHSQRWTPHYTMKYSILESPPSPHVTNSTTSFYDLAKADSVTLEDKTSEGYGYYILCHISGRKDFNAFYVFYDIVKEEDARRLKKAFEHLIKLAKADKDPFN